MNKHKKLAIFIAPFLLIAGYILADYFAEQQANKKQVFSLFQEGTCNLSKTCLFTSNELKLNLYQTENDTILNANFALTEAVLFVVDEKVEAMPLKQKGNAFYWQTDVINLRNKTTLNMRLIAKIKGASYISEFVAIVE